MITLITVVWTVAANRAQSKTKILMQLYAQIIVPRYDLEWEKQTSLRKDYNEME